MTDISFTTLLGKTLREIINDTDENELIFKTMEGEIYKLYHSQDCCESVSIEEIVGDLDNLLGSPILVAEERCSKSKEEKEESYGEDSQTWTFYALSTIKGHVDIRWFGKSNGYYSENVSFCKVEKERVIDETI